MDKISQLPDELLLKVLLFLPTRVAVSTSILSKRWEFLWLWLPKLEYDNRDDSKKSLLDFINFNMPLHRAPVIESLCLNFRSVEPNAEDIRMWIVFAVSRCIRELSVKLASCSIFKLRRAKLPTSLYTCKSLVILELKDVNVVDVPRMACLPSLKTLLLKYVAYEDDKSFQQFLSSCPVLEDLVLDRFLIEDFGTPSVIVPSLQRLTLKIYRGYLFKGIIINTPSLKYFKATDSIYEYNEYDNDSDSYSFYSEDMPKLEEVEVDSTYPDIDNCVSSITCIKRLSLCLGMEAEKALYREGIVFNQLQHLKLCSCVPDWSKLLFRLLKDSPLLRELEVYQNDGHTHSSGDPQVCWQNQLDCVPTCLLSSLETFKWTGKYRWQKEIYLMKYILRNARYLKAATFLFSSSYTPEEQDILEMVKQDLSLSFRGSKTCHLVFL